MTDTPAAASTIVDATTGATPTTGQPTTSGATHQTSGPSGPDPTGLRGSLEKNFAAAAEKATQQQNETKKPAVSRETEQTEGARGPDGKFLPKTQAEATPDEAPSSWRTETKALWKEIDVKFGPEQGKLLKEELRKRENDFRSGLKAKEEEVGKYKGFHEQVHPALAPVMEQWQRQGVQPAQALQHLISLQTNFQRDPAGTIRWLAQAAKLDLSTLADGVAQQASTNQTGGVTADPQLAQLINGLQSELREIKTSWASQTTAAATAEIQSVIDEKGPDGQPVRPLFNDVFEDVKAEIQLLRAQHPDWSPRQTAAQAYDTAVWRNPQTRQKMIEGTEAQKRASVDAEQRQRAAEAAAKQVRGGPPNMLNGAANPANLRGTLEAKYAATYGGGQRL